MLVARDQSSNGLQPGAAPALDESTPGGGPDASAGAAAAQSARAGNGPLSDDAAAHLQAHDGNGATAALANRPCHFQVWVRARNTERIDVGHAFVVITGPGRASGYGLHPADGSGLEGDLEILGHFGHGVPGRVTDDRNLESASQLAIDQPITSQQFTRLKAAGDAARAAPPRYDFVHYNCVNFCQTLGHAIGIDVPGPTTLGIEDPQKLLELEKAKRKGSPAVASGAAGVPAAGSA